MIDDVIEEKTPEKISAVEKEELQEEIEAFDLSDLPKFSSSKPPLQVIEPEDLKPVKQGSETNNKTETGSGAFAHKESAASTAAQDLLRNFKVVNTSQGGEVKKKIKVNRNLLDNLRKSK